MSGARPIRRSGLAPLVALLPALGCGASESEQDAERAPAREGEILFARAGDGATEMYAVSPAGGEPRRVAAGEGALYPVANGALALRVADAGGRPAERLVAIEEDAPRLLTPASARVRNPSPAPGGAWVAFESDGASFRDIYRVEVESGALSRLTDDAEGNFEPAVSPDGARIAFVSSRDGNAEIYLMDSRGDGERRLTAFHRDDWSPRWSPDGRELAFLSDREGGSHIFTMKPDGSGQEKLDAAAGPGEHASEIAWSPDGRRIAYVLREHTSAPEVWVIDVESQETTRLTPAGLAGANPSWSPDGEALVLSGRRGRSDDLDLYLVRADGSGLTPLTGGPADDWQPAWRPL